MALAIRGVPKAGEAQAYVRLPGVPRAVAFGRRFRHPVLLRGPSRLLRLQVVAVGPSGGRDLALWPARRPRKLPANTTRHGSSRRPHASVGAWATRARGRYVQGTCQQRQQRHRGRETGEPDREAWRTLRGNEAALETADQTHQDLAESAVHG